MPNLGGAKSGLKEMYGFVVGIRPNLKGIGDWTPHKATVAVKGGLLAKTGEGEKKKLSERGGARGWGKAGVKPDGFTFPPNAPSRDLREKKNRRMSGGGGRKIKLQWPPPRWGRRGLHFSV